MAATGLCTKKQVTCSSGGTGAGSGAAGVLAGLPLDVVRVRQQVDVSTSRSMLRQALAMVQLEGPATLLRGASYPLATITVQARTRFLKIWSPPHNWPIVHASLLYWRLCPCSLFLMTLLATSAGKC